MLRVHVSTNGAATAKYFKQSLEWGDFDLGKSASLSRWCGEGAARLGLEGPVDAKHFESLCHNVHPDTGEQLTPRMRADRRVCYDINLHVPKSVSVAAEVLGDRALLDAAIEANESVMSLVERDAQCRVRRGGMNEDRSTANLVRARFVHETSRPVDGLPDPHVHLHNIVFNGTFDAVEDRWKALQLGRVVQNAPYFEAVFLSDLAKRVQAMGYSIYVTGKAWEIAGFSPEVLARYSRRTALIEAVAAKRGISDPARKAELGAKTRRPKSESKSAELIHKDWDERLLPHERHNLLQAKGRGEFVSDKGLQQAVRYAVLKSFERSAVVPETALVAEVLRACPGQVTADGVRAELERYGVVRREHEGRPVVTTREALMEEKRLVDLARRGRGSRGSMASPKSKEYKWLTDQEQRAIDHLLTSQDLVTLVRVRGVGQSEEFLRTARLSFNWDLKVSPWGFSATAAGANGELKRAGFQKPMTVAQVLSSQEPWKLVGKGVWFVTEAHRLSIKAASDLISLASEHEVRLVLVGDSKAKGSIFRGNPLHTLERHAGLPSVSIDTVRHASKAHAQVIEALNKGLVPQAVERLTRLGAFKDVAAGDACRLAGKEFAQRAHRKSRTLIIAPTRGDAAKATKAARRAMLKKGKVRGERSRRQLKSMGLSAIERTRGSNYTPGTVVEFTRARGRFKLRERWTVTGRNILGKVEIRRGLRLRTLPLRYAESFEVYRRESIRIGVGDYIRITRSGWTRAVVDIPLGIVSRRHARPTRKLQAGAIHRVRGFTVLGHMVLDNGFILPKKYGHIEYGYASTAGSSVSRHIDHAICVQPRGDEAAGSVERLARAVGMGRKSVSVFAEPGTLEKLRDDARSQPSALDLTKGRFAPEVREIVSDSLERLARRTFGMRPVGRELDRVMER